MNRLTIRDPESTTKENGVCCTSFLGAECSAMNGHCEHCSVNEDVWERLAQYEDTGVEPEAVAALMQIAKENRLFVLPVPVGGDGWCVHTTEDGSKQIMHGSNIAPVLAWQQDGKWNIFSMDNVFPTQEAAAQAIEAAAATRNDNIAPLRPRKDGEHGAD